MGMTERELLFISPRAFYNKLRGFNQLRQSEYELTRLQTVELLNIQIEGKHRIRSPQSLWKFPWEAHRVDIEATKVKAIRFREKVERFEKRHGNK